jgi:hypothetical protein
MNKIFDEERSLFQKSVNDTCKFEKSTPLIDDLIKLELLKEGEKSDKMSPVSELYSLLGPEKFSEVVELMNGRTVQFPTSDSFKETVMIAIYYYYRFFKGKDFKDIDQIFENEDISHVKMGIRVNFLHSFLQKQTQLLESRRKKD